MPKLAKDAAFRVVDGFCNLAPTLDLIFRPKARTVDDALALLGDSGAFGYDQAGCNALAVILAHQRRRNVICGRAGRVIADIQMRLGSARPLRSMGVNRSVMIASFALELPLHRLLGFGEVVASERRRDIRLLHRRGVPTLSPARNSGDAAPSKVSRFTSAGVSPSPEELNCNWPR